MAVKMNVLPAGDAAGDPPDSEGRLHHGLLRRKRLKYLEENEGALRVSLSQQELEQIDSLAPKGSASGDRYPALSMKYVNG